MAEKCGFGDRSEGGVCICKDLEQGIDRWLKDLNLKSTHSIFLKELGTFLGQSDRDTLDRSLTMYLNRMDLEIEKLREGLATKRKISRCLGVMSGIFLVVVLL